MTAAATQTAVAGPEAPAETLHGGLRWAVRCYLLMLRWDLEELRQVLPIMVMMQILVGAGTVVGFGFFLGDAPQSAILFLATGATVMPLLTVGLVFLPSNVGEKKLRGTYDYMFSLPVTRISMALSTLTLAAIVALRHQRLQALAKLLDVFVDRLLPLAIRRTIPCSRVNTAITCEVSRKSSRFRTMARSRINGTMLPIHTVRLNRSSRKTTHWPG